MTIDPAVIPGLLILLAELAALTVVGYVVVRVALRQADDRVALAQGLVVGPALWGLIVNFVMYAVPGLAGAGIGWAIVIAGCAGMAWRARDAIRPRPRVAVGFTIAVLALLWIALASRQVLGISDPQVQLGQAAAIRAGGFPPGLSWTPGISEHYHYGISLVAGLLGPPFGPDLAFVWELMGAFTWTSYALIVISVLLQRSCNLATLLTAPLLLSVGAWTFIDGAVDIARMPIPTGIPAAGLRASLMDVYWPDATYVAVLDMRYAALPDTWNHAFPMAYALVVVVLGATARTETLSWPAAMTLAALVGFAGLISITIAPLLLLLWAGLLATVLVQLQRSGRPLRETALRSGVGLALAALLIIVGGRLTDILTGSASSGLVLASNLDQTHWRALGAFDARPGGLALLGVGPVAVASIAAVLGWRDRLVVTFATGAALLALAWVALDYPPAPWDINRMAGHARNLALVALLLALSARLSDLPSTRWRCAAGVLVIGLVVWPTVVAPARYLARAIGQGTEIANALPRERPQGQYRHGGRFVLEPRPSDGVAAYIRERTAIDARVLSPYAHGMTFATGRPNASGFVGLLHYFSYHGPEYLDAINYLEPAAIRRLGVSYVHAPRGWADSLPDRAAEWLNDPDLFELLVRDAADALFRVRPAFLELATAPTPGSFEALRQAIPASATIYAPAQLQELSVTRVLSVLSHARLLGRVNPTPIHLLTPWPSQPVGTQTPDVVILPASIEPRMFSAEGRQPIWWNADVAVYAPTGAVDPVMPPPLSEAPPEPPVSVQVSDVRAVDGRLSFTVTIDDHAPDQWTGQDWRLVAGEASPWAIPTELEPDGRAPVVAQWFAGQTASGRGTTTRQYLFDAGASRLALRDDGRETVIATSGDGVGAGIWMLSLRLLRVEDRGTYEAQEDVAVIPVLQIEISETGEVTGLVYDNAPGADAPPSAEPGTGR